MGSPDSCVYNVVTWGSHLGERHGNDSTILHDVEAVLMLLTLGQRTTAMSASHHKGWKWEGGSNIGRSKQAGGRDARDAVGAWS
ncbi:hypothetical protein DACRYDRAFT_25225 [Dacryopinax primogenitus]|uniref:Uncharacterized protein n=1 Tax=Dacryopinax primogenitus (strain DJM 731) TaxID=1858805 RepID=M5FUY6_DACPD|nr:uncharacterized protein DACRYDRAFT_25225 [Dacryopinax primogenitus]EJT97096.1 hypothetical protein DACRYDRAFT_25225 [Dacryopinax primogenitus]